MHLFFHLSGRLYAPLPIAPDKELALASLSGRRCLWIGLMRLHPLANNGDVFAQQVHHALAGTRHSELVLLLLEVVQPRESLRAGGRTFG